MKKSKIVIFAILAMTILSTLPLLGVNAEVINSDFILPRDTYKYGGDFRMPRTTDFTTLNPYLGTGATWMVTIISYENLVMVDPDWGVRPWLAESWDISDDGLTYTFYLQPDAIWSDGMPVIADDVKYTFDQWKIQELSRMLPYTKNINEITVIDEKTVQFELYEPDVTFLERSLVWPALCIVPKHIWETIEDWNTWDNDDPEMFVGSGPFTLKEWKKGEYCQLVANENYWQGRAYVDSITYIVINMRDIQLLAFEKGEVDIFSGLFGNEVSRFLDPAKYKVYAYEDAGQPNFYANMRQRPGNDTYFRKALWYSVDREQILDAAHYGYGVIPTHMLATIYERSGWMPPETVTEPQNLTMAASILDEGGYLDTDGDGWREYPNGDKMKLGLTVSDYERYLKSAEIIIEDMKSIGVNIGLDILAAGTWGARIVTTHDFDLTYFRYGPGGGDPLEPLSWQTSWGENWIGFFNETYDNLYIEASKVQDPEERLPMIWDLCRILAENYAFVPHVSNVNLKVINNEKWDSDPTCLPYGPFSNLQMWHYFNIHLKGDITGVGTLLTSEAPSTAIMKEPVVIKTTLVDESGNPLEGMFIDYVVGGFAVGGSMTDASGASEFTWVPLQDGSYDIQPHFRGTDKYASSESTAHSIQVGAATPDEPDEPEPGFQIPGFPMESTILGVVLGIAAVAYLLTKKS